MYAGNFTKEYYFYRLISAFSMNAFSAFYLFSSIIDFLSTVHTKRLGLRRLRSLPKAFNVQQSHLMLLGIPSLRVETFRQNLLMNNDVIAGIPSFLAFSRLDFCRPLALSHFPNSGCMAIQPMLPESPSLMGKTGRLSL